MSAIEAEAPFTTPPAYRRSPVWLRDLLLPMLRHYPSVVSDVDFYTDSLVIKRAETGEVLMQISALECVEATDTLESWNAFWGRLKKVLEI